MKAADAQLPPVIADLLEEGFLDDSLIPDQGLAARITYKDFQENDRVDLCWYSVSPDGEVSDWSRFWTLTAADPAYDPDTKTLNVVVPKGIIAAATGGRAFFNWLLTPQHAVDAVASTRLVFQVGRLPPVVQVRHSQRLQINPDLSAGDVEVVAPTFTSLSVGDIATLYAVRDPEGAPTQASYQLTIEAGDLGQPLVWQLPKTFLKIAQATGKPVDLSVELLLGGASGTSLALAAQRFAVVAALPGREAPVELVGLNERMNKAVALDPTELPDGLEVRLPLGAHVRLGDSILLRVVGERAGNDLQLQAVADLTTLNTGDMSVRIPQNWLLAHDGQNLTFEWQLDRPGANFSGEPLTVEVRTSRVLTHPTVPRATSEQPEGDDFLGFITAQSVVKGLDVQVPTDFSVRPEETLTLHYEGDPTGGRYQTSTPVTGTERTFSIPAPYLAPNMGGEAKRAPIYYTIEMANGVSMRSANYKLLVKPLGLNALHNIECTQAPGGAPLSISELKKPPHNGNANITQPTWVLMAPGQRILIEATGVSRQDGSELVESLLDTTAVEVGPVDTLLPVSFLERLRLNEQFSIRVKIAFDTRNYILQKQTSLQLIA